MSAAASQSREWHAMRARQQAADECCENCGAPLDDGEAFYLDGDGPLCYGCFDAFRGDGEDAK